MLITLKSIVRKLPLKEMPICYYNPSGNEQYPLYFMPISGKYETKYNSLDEAEKRNYISDHAQIYIPNMSIRNYSTLYKQKDSLTWEYTLDKIHQLGLRETSVEESEDMFTLYGILHEIGHWLHFNDVGKNVWTYVQDNIGGDKISHLLDQLQEKVSAQGRFLPEDLAERRRLLEAYYAIPNEKIANDYADKYFCQMWQEIKKL